MNIKSRFTGRWKPKDGDSVTILSAPIRYKKDSQGTVPPAASANWQSSIPSDMGAGDFLWTWTRVNYSDGTHTDSYCVSKWGEDGGGIASSNVKYSVQANQVDPSTISNWGDFPAPSQMIEGYWLYTRTHIEYEGSIQPSNSYSVSKIGQGSHYAGCEEYWALGTDSVTPPNNPPTPGQYASRAAVTFDDTTWSQDRPTQNNNKPYIWNFEISADSSGTCYVTKAICIGNYNKSISSIAQTYAISAYNTPASGSLFPSDISSGDWKTVAQAAAPTEAKPYQWNRNITTYTDGTTDTEYHISAIRGNDGKGTVRIDLDNDNDTMLFDGQGNLIGDPNELYCKSLIRLYVNGTLPNNQPTFTVDEKSSFLAASIYNGNELRVSKGTFFGSSSSSGYVIVGCDWLNVHYSVRFTVKKLINQDKYEVFCTPNAVCVNTDDYSSAPSVEVRVWRTKVDGTRENITALPSSDYKLLLNGDTSNPLSYSSGKATFTPSLSHSQEVVSLVFQSKLLDSETIPVSTVENGDTPLDGNDMNMKFMAAFEKPAKPTSSNPGSIWLDAAPVLDDLDVKHIGDWFPLADGYHRAPYITHSEHTIQILQFTTSKANQKVYIEIKCKTENNYDFICVGFIDQNPPVRSSDGYYSRLSGVDVKRLVEVDVENAGAHYIGISFFKDSSGTPSGEYAMYKIGIPPVWETHVLTWNGNTPATWSEPSVFAQGKYSIRQDSERQNLLRMAGFPSEEQIGSWWNIHNGEIQFNGYDGNNVFYSSNNDANNYKDVLRQHVFKTGIDTLKPNKWYTLSFVCKGVGTLNTYFYPSGTGHVLTAAGVYIDLVFHTPAATDMVSTFELTSEWTRHSVTFKTSSAFSGEVMLLFRLLKGNGKSVYISCPKLEESSMATRFNLSYGDIQAMVIGEDGFPDECGVWKDDIPYVWDDVKRQYVYYQINGQYKAFFVKRKGMVVPAGTAPSAGGNTYWEQGSTDVSTLLANTIIGANVKIGGFLASMNVFKSQNERVEIDGNNNIIKVLNAARNAIIAAMGDVYYPFFSGGANGANAVWSVDAKGKMKSEDADITGKVSANSLTLPFSQISETDHTYAIDDPCNIVLPKFAGGNTSILRLPDNNSDFNGRRVIVSWTPMRTSMEANHAITGRIRCPNKDTGSAFYSSYFASRIDTAAGGIAEFICISGTWWLVNIHSNGVQYTQYI